MRHLNLMPSVTPTSTATGGVYEVEFMNNNWIHIETRSEKLRQLSNELADHVAKWGLKRGVDSPLMAEAADELWRMADALDALAPPATAQFQTTIANAS